MKKLALTIAIVLGMNLVASSQNRGLFDLGSNSYEQYDDTPSTGLFLPQTHGANDDANGTPLGGGALLLIGFGAAYAGLRRKNRK